MNPLIRRLKALKDLLALERPTSKAAAYSEWPSPPQVNWEKEGSEALFSNLEN
jgi:hypothetical protein